MALTFNTGPEAPPPPIDPAVRLEELVSRVEGQVASWARLDADQPMFPAVTSELALARLRFDASVNAERPEASRFASMVTKAAARALAFEPDVRLALLEGRTPPIFGDVEVAERIISGERADRATAFAAIEAAGKNYISAARRAAGSRALLLAAKLRPVVASYQPTIRALAEAESRIDPAIDAASMLLEFEQAGLL